MVKMRLSSVFRAVSNAQEVTAMAYQKTVGCDEECIARWPQSAFSVWSNCRVYVLQVRNSAP
jgi:hypothetical protein